MQIVWLAWMLGCDGGDSGTTEAAGGWAELEGLGVLGWAEGGSVYLCGVGEHVSDSRWFVRDESEAWVSTDGAWRLERDGDRVSLESPSSTWEGTLAVFDDGGLYDAAPEGCRSGAVVYAGQVAGSWCDGEGAFEQVEPIDTVIGSPESFEAFLSAEPTYTFTFQRLP